MSAWLNARLRNDPVQKHELQATEAIANIALERILADERSRGRTVRAVSLGSEQRWEFWILRAWWQPIGFLLGGLSSVHLSGAASLDPFSG
jgi:hypothetical protein